MTAPTPSSSIPPLATESSSAVGQGVTPNDAYPRGRRKGSGLSWSATLALVFLVIALVVGAGAWLQQRRFDSAGRELAAQMQLFSTQLGESKRESKQALLLVEGQAKQIVELQQSLADAREQFTGLEQAWQAFNRGLEDSMLANDIERLVTLASQQLRLASNVNNAVMALETALSTLVRAERPRFAAVQRAISADLDRLRSVPMVDVSAISVRLDTVTNLIGRAPLLVPDAVVPRVAALAPDSAHRAASETSTTASVAVSATAPATVSTSASEAIAPTAPVATSDERWWDVVWAKTRGWSKSVASFMAKELASVVSIQRVNDASALLMSPEQGAQLRANLRSRVLTAQMALLMHQPAIWRAEIANIEASLTSRYDPKSIDTVTAIRLIRELATVQISAALPDMADSISALEAVRLLEPNNKSED